MTHAKTEPAAVGFRPHSGWSTAVTVILSGSRPVVVDRRRVDLSTPDVPVQPYHAAQALSLDDAAALVARTQAVADGGALRGLDVIAAAHPCVSIVAAGIPESAARAPDDLARVLSSHALLHTAEGELFRESIASAAHFRCLHVHRLPAREVLAHVASVLGRSEDDLTRTVQELGKLLGPPWTKDEKEATLAAWVALVSYRLTSR